jgi:hypothetical protein
VAFHYKFAKKERIKIMTNFEKILMEKGYTDKDGKAEINALNFLSRITTHEFVHELYRCMDSEKLESLTNIYNHFAFLFNEGNDDEAVRFYYILVDVTDLGMVLNIELAGDVEIVFAEKATQRAYLYEFLADFREIVEDFQMEAGLIDFKDGKMQTVEYGSTVPLI